MDTRENDNLSRGQPGSSAEIEERIDETRHRMDHTIDEIAERLHPRHLLDDLLNYWKLRKGDGGAPDMHRVKESVEGCSRAIADEIKEHPLPSLMIGAGLALWFAQGRRRYEYEGEDECLSPDADEEEFAAENAAGKERVAHAAERAKRQTTERSRRLRGQARAGMERAGQKARDARERGIESFSRISDDYPLATGAGFMAVGLLAGLMLPHTRAEDRWVGERAEQVKREAKARGQKIAREARHVAEAAGRAAVEEARAQGLTPSALEGKAAEVRHSVQAAAKDAAREEGLVKGQGQEEKEQATQVLTPPSTPAP